LLSLVDSESKEIHNKGLGEIPKQVGNFLFRISIERLMPEGFLLSITLIKVSPHTRNLVEDSGLVCKPVMNENIVKSVNLIPIIAKMLNCSRIEFDRIFITLLYFR